MGRPAAPGPDTGTGRPAGDTGGALSRPARPARPAARPPACPDAGGQAGREDLLLSLRFSARRNPDIYNDHPVGLLKHADRDALEAVER
jgi:hypothetical protein